MPNSYFQFKQFRIEQGGTAMKVTTEGCVLGAWVSKVAVGSGNVLDIGAGTGLLSLMVAQKLPDVEVHAVELDATAAEQARQNFEASPWNDRLVLHEGPVQDQVFADAFELIISNPPFFNDSLRSPQEAINLARHDSSLSQTDLLTAISRLLSSTGTAFVLYPEREALRFAELAVQQGFFVCARLDIYNSPGSKKLRTIVGLSKANRPMHQAALHIKSPTGGYTMDFVALLKDYYLHL
ncbi:tRNA1(Val) (adenine(37)-N6)-methyltransferase [Marinoscillum furvescens]|uniref:tRNA1(Val) (adenine(37)-N6)-methyltransferase n=1 Tax=Marinoscillum furvescens DSM 4134 TaxID=1122208 RepID=A0A3D9LKH9_MARFU|nr:methyltransferase [Marinoscillum furvescens]REE05752.1 tRNA1Val (adenine37-N6)-methyltransferase [Marinoscillum furvescens DSM 4134]